MTYSITVTAPAAAVAVLTFHDPARDNQLCWAAMDELAQRLRQCRESGTRVVILATPQPGPWLQHAWLRDLCDGLRGEAPTGSGSGWFEAQEELTREEMVSIAAISGDTCGGGAELGWACDIRIVEEQARFAQPEVDMGITTGIGGCSRLARLAGRTLATERVLTGSYQPARRLYEAGAITRLVPAGGSLAAATALAASLAAQAPAAIAGLKRILAYGDEHPLADSLRFEQDTFQAVAATAAALENMERTQARYDAGDR